VEGYARAIYAGGGSAEQVTGARHNARSRRRPDSGEIWYLRAVALRMVDRIDEMARRARARALELVPGCWRRGWDAFQIPVVTLRGDTARGRRFLDRWLSGLGWFEHRRTECR
jgi:hypothetical protein